MAQNSVVVGVPRELTSQNRAGMAGVTPASSIPRIQFSTGTAKALSDFSFDMFQMSGRVEDELDQQAHAEATVEGAAAGATGSFEVRDYTTIRNRAYNQAGIQTFISTLETRSIFGTAEIQRQYANDPAGMAAALQQYHAGIAGELNVVSPGAGATYLQRSAMRTVPAIEAARDARFALTRDQANAALIENQVALDAELSAHSANLFSDNPARSQAAASALAMVGNELMRVYDAVDPVSGKPLYSATEKAKARAAFNERVFETATLAWFDGQEDKAGAYTKFIEGDFSFDLNVADNLTPSGFDWGPYLTGGAAARSDSIPGMDVALSGGIAAMIADAPPNVRAAVKVMSGFRSVETQEILWQRALKKYGSAAAARKWVAPPGNSQHGHGRAADFEFGSDEAKQWFHANASKYGLRFPLSHEPWHIETANARSPDAGVQTVDMRRTMSPAAMARLESEMRSRISFQNSMADRAQREEDRAHADRQEVGFTLLTDAYLNGGQKGVEPLTRDMIQTMLERQEISWAHSRQALQWLATPAPDKSNDAVFEELQRRMYEGDDIEAEVQASLSQLSRADASALLAKNQSLNSERASTMTEEQRGYLSMIRQTVAPEGMLAQLDAGASMRAFNAQDEYRKRIAEGEDAAVVARDIVDRAQRDTVAFEEAKIQRMLRPRFAVPEGNEGRINSSATALALQNARRAGTISEAAYLRQRALLLEWARLQGDVN